jgi:septal ring factor EnvC (AmiA/AmiB activator)
MIALIRTRSLNVLRSRVSEAEAEVAAARSEAEKCLEQSGNLLNSLEQAEESERELRITRDRATADAARFEGELEALRAHSLLDTEDRQALRMLLRTVRKQSGRADRVYVLYRFGDLHSVHVTRDAAEIAAEAEGAPRDGWTSSTTCCASESPAAEIPWRIRPVPLGGTR